MISLKLLLCHRIDIQESCYWGLDLGIREWFTSTFERVDTSSNEMKNNLSNQLEKGDQWHRINNQAQGAGKGNAKSEKKKAQQKELSQDR